MKRGFTLVEMLVVLVIIGILASLLAGALQKARERGRRTKAAAEARELAKAWKMFHLTYERLPSLGDMDAAAVAILQGENVTENPNKIKFYEFPPEARTAGFRDPWGHLYHVSRTSDPSTNRVQYMTRVFFPSRRAGHHE